MTLCTSFGTVPSTVVDPAEEFCGVEVVVYLISRRGG